ncbi:hypothetical protein DICVIV_05382, partial [Dictyocaulus viviparus]
MLKLVVLFVALCLIFILVINTFSTELQQSQAYNKPSIHLGSLVFEDFPSSWLREYYQKQASDRKTLLGQLNNSNYKSFYNVIVPEVSCPDLVRVGNVNNGGRYVCNPKALPIERCRFIHFNYLLLVILNYTGNKIL